ncbi:SufD family Fe-S cluster assembly protein [Ilumatobacter coccineus]|uniref:Putative FeS assembly protein SufB n=1 Tax=Ilumatobacter coccineus (strain NBRC 103263 / KCTC 29153 / YM16-304) TaxID=1313172 RepID=A0A6C7EAX8_ILUCY|nr:SufD family Fe-S cluster assembly protein [Ilumatobacter coccineus]BAN01788.1 putative FeS assembly protein SufB [Ilumatobacter coccineus YM16-304]
MSGSDAARRADEPGWLTELRRRALEVLAEPSTVAWFADAVPDLDLRGELDRHLALARGGARVRATEVAHAESSERSRSLADLGVVCCSLDDAVHEHPDLVEEHLGSVVGPDADPFAALNTALWTGGTFVHVPPGVEVDLPVQTASSLGPGQPGRFERTLVVAEVGASVTCVAGCSAPIYTDRSTQSAVTEVVVRPRGRVVHATVQNWSAHVDQFATKRARVEAGGSAEWIDGNIGARRTVDRTGVELVGDGASGGAWSVAAAGSGQQRRAHVDVVHAAPNTTATVVATSITVDDGRSTGDVHVIAEPTAAATRTDVTTDRLHADDVTTAANAASAWAVSAPHADVGDVRVSHHTGHITGSQRFYLMSRGLSVDEADATIVDGFIEPVTSRLAMEYAVEWSRLVELTLRGSVG